MCGGAAKYTAMALSNSSVFVKMLGSHDNFIMSIKMTGMWGLPSWPFPQEKNLVSICHPRSDVGDIIISSTVGFYLRRIELTNC